MNKKFLDTEYLDQFSPLEIKVINNNFEGALKKFKSIVQKEKILALFKDKMSYEKPSDKKRRENREAIAKQKQVELREQQMRSGEWEKIEKKKQQKREERIQRRLELINDIEGVDNE